MKSNAPKQRAGGGGGGNRDLRPRAAAKAPASPTAAVAEGSVLDRVVERGSLGDAWAAATAGGGAAVRDRGVTERRLGASLGGVEVFSGRRAQSLLQRLGARGAARGQQVLLADPSDHETLVHELAHTVQARHAGEGGGIVRADDEAEQEAEHVALRFRSNRRLRLRARIGRKAIALRRLRDPARGELPPLSEDDQLEPIEVPQRRDERRARTADGGETAAAEAPAPTGPEAEAQAEPQAAQDDARAGTTDEAQPQQAEAEAAGEQAPEQSPDRREAVDGLLTEEQDDWDAGAETADEYEAEACPRHRVGEGEQPFARGPPLDVPATQEMPELEDPEPDAPDREALRRAERDVQTNLDVAPEASSVDAGSIDAETDAERRNQAQQVRSRVDRLLSRQSVERPEDPTVTLEGETDIEARKREAESNLSTATQREGEAAHTATEEDFGEERMAPVRDPTEGHDTNLDGLEIPEVDLEAEVETATRDRIATAANAGTLSLEDAVVVRQEEMTRITSLAEDRGQRRDVIDDSVGASERAFDRLCREGETERQRVRTQTEGQVQERRQTWRRAADDHVSTRETEANTLVREKTAHARTLADDADREAQEEIDRANTRATDQAADVERRARAKSDQSESRSWWQRGIDWVRERLNDLVSWIDDFIDAAHRAIDVMLDAAADVAHAIVENGRQAVQATLDLAHRGVDVIADNLPGELGDLAREHRDDMHAYLDRQQEAVDAYADGLHEDIDTAIEDVREDLHAGLEDFREGVHDVADAANEVLDVAENGIMALLQRYFPEVAAFVEGGILGPIRQAGAQLQEWAQAALDATGLGDLQGTLQELHETRFCQAPTEEEQAADCEAFKQRLEGLKANFDALLESPVAQRIQGMLESSQEEQENQQVEAVTGFFSFIRWVAEPVYQWWQSVEPQVSAALDWLGDMAQAAWEHIARALGLDVSLPPLEAIRQALEEAWQAIAEAAEPLISQLRRAWQWVVEESPLASVIAFFRAIPEAVSAIGQLLGEMTDAAGAWLAEAAEALANTIMPIVNRALGAVADVLEGVVDRVVGWADQLLAAFDALLSWEAAHELLGAVATVLQAWATPIRLAIQLFRDCGERALRGLAHVVRNLADYARTILDIVSGIVVLIVGFPLSLVPWFAGTVWLYLIPECYKAPILNFMLDMAIRFVQFFPEPADFMLAALYQGLLGFLQGLRAAPDSQKVGAMNLMASLFAGNAEALAGFVVGLAEGVWEATGGTIVFLIQAAIWLISLPFKLVQWAAGLVSGGGPGQARSRGDDTPEPAADDEATEDAAEEVGGSLGREMASLERGEQPRQRGPPSAETMREAETVAQRAEAEPEVEAPAPDEDDEEAEPGTDVTAIERAGEDAEAGAEGEGGESESQGEGAGPVDADPDRPPAIPEAIAGLRGTLQQLMASGFTREDVQAALDGVRQTLRTFIGRIARTAAQQMLASLNADGAAFAIGRTMGSVVGQLLVEVILAIFTGGASTALTAAKAALTGARAAGRLASVLRRIRAAIQPALRAMARLRSSLGRVVGQLRRWLDDVVRWMRGVGRRVRSRVGRMRRGRRGGVGRGRGRGRGRSGRRGRRGDRRRGRDRDPDGRRRDRDGSNHLNRVLPAIRRAVRHSLSDGTGRTRLRMRLLGLKLRYRIRVLRLRRDGLILAANSPPQVVVRARQLSPYDLGRLIRPLLERAEQRYRTRLAGDNDVDSAFARLEGGSPLDTATGRLSRGQRAEVMRRTPLRTNQRGDFGGVSGRQMRSRGHPQSSSFTVLDIPVAGDDAYPAISRALVGLRQNTNLNSRQISAMLSTSRREQERLMAAANLSQEHRALLRGVAALDDLERARQGSVGTANAVARLLGAEGHATLAEQFGDPRTTLPSGDAATLRGRMDPTDIRAGGARRAGALAPATMVGAISGERFEQQRRIGNIFRRLLRATETARVYEDGNDALASLARMVQRWLDSKNPRDLESEDATRLIAELVTILEGFD